MVYLVHLLDDDSSNNCVGRGYFAKWWLGKRIGQALNLFSRCFADKNIILVIMKE